MNEAKNPDEWLPTYNAFPWKSRKAWEFRGTTQVFTLVYDNGIWRTLEPGRNQEPTASEEGQSG